MVMRLHPVHLVVRVYQDVAILLPSSPPPPPLPLPVFFVSFLFSLSLFRWWWCVTRVCFALPVY